jgi:hypothetical protein
MRPEEKITLERPRPLGSGFLLPFKSPQVIQIDARSVDVLRTQKRLVVSAPEIPALANLESAAQECLIQRNAQWFKNTLTPEEIRAMFQPLRNADGFLSLRFSPGHLPKDCRINDRPVADWDDLEKRWLLVEGSAVPERIHLECVAQGVYLKKQTAELLVKIQVLSVHLEPVNPPAPNIDEYKAEIEAEWAMALDAYSIRVRDEIERLESRIREKKEKCRHLKDVFSRACALGTEDPEWNRSIEYLQREIDQKNYFI